MRGRFITLEGSEGAGKSSNLAYLQQLLDEAGVDYIVTREPGGTRLGEMIREMLLDKTNSDIDDDTELLMMFAARSQHLTQLIRPALAEGKWVLCDRFTDATYAYQGGGRGIDTSRIAVLEQWVHGDLQPDLTLLLDLPVEQGLKRAGQRSEPDRFEVEKGNFFKQVRNAYLARAEADAKRFRIIDASQPLEAVQTQIKIALSAFLQKQVGQ